MATGSQRQQWPLSSPHHWRAFLKCKLKLDVFEDGLKQHPRVEYVQKRMKDPNASHLHPYEYVITFITGEKTKFGITDYDSHHKERRIGYEHVYAIGKMASLVREMMMQWLGATWMGNNPQQTTSVRWHAAMDPPQCPWAAASFPPVPPWRAGKQHATAITTTTQNLKRQCNSDTGATAQTEQGQKCRRTADLEPAVVQELRWAFKDLMNRPGAAKGQVADPILTQRITRLLHRAAYFDIMNQSSVQKCHYYLYNILILVFPMSYLVILFTFPMLSYKFLLTYILPLYYMSLF